MIKKLAKVIVTATLTVAATALAACTPPSGSSGAPVTSPASKPVTISAPPKADVAEVQVKVTGPAGESLDVYAFDGGWDKDEPPTCTETDDPTRTVQLGPEGTTTAKVSVGHPGVWWWVVSSPTQGVTSECGAVTTIARYGDDLDFAFGGPNSPSSSLNAYQGTLDVGDPVSVWVTATHDPPKDAEGWPVTVNWLGPFDSVPQAAAGCRDENAPVGASSKGTAPSEFSNDDGDELSVELPEPGVYAVVASTPGTEWNAPVTTPCDNTTPILVAE